MWGQHRRQATEDEVLQGFTDKFGANVEIEFSPDSYDTSFSLVMAAGNAPDIFLWWNYPQLTVRIWAARHHCLMSMAAARSTSASTSTRSERRQDRRFALRHPERLDVARHFLQQSAV